MVPSEQESVKTNSLAQLLHILVEVNSRTINIEEQIKKATLTIHESKLLSVKLSANLEQLEKNALIARKKVITYEAELKFTQAKEDEKRKQLETIDNPKEYKTLHREIELLKKQNNANEEQLLTFWQEAEALDNNLVLERSKTHKKLEELTQTLLTNNQLLIQLKEEHIKALEEKTIKSTMIPAEWLSRYNRMQTSVQDPIVSVTNHECGACFYTIVAQEYARIKKGEVLLCRSCYRFLYFDTEKEQNPQKES